MGKQIEDIFIYLHKNWGGGGGIINCQLPWLLFSVWVIQNIVNVVQGCVQISAAIYEELHRLHTDVLCKTARWISPSTRSQTPSTSTPWFRTRGREAWARREAKRGRQTSSRPLNDAWAEPHANLIITPTKWDCRHVGWTLLKEPRGSALK